MKGLKHKLPRVLLPCYVSTDVAGGCCLGATILVNYVEDPGGALGVDTVTGGPGANDLLSHYLRGPLGVLIHHAIVVVLLQLVNLGLMIVYVEHGIKLLQLELLCVEPIVGLHHVVAVAEVPLREFHLIKFILDHCLIGKHVIQRADVCMGRRKLCRLLYQALLLVVVLIRNSYVGEAAGRGGGARNHQG